CFCALAHQFLDVLGARALPRDEGGGNANLDFRVFALWHRSVCKYSPQHRCGQQNPGDVPILDKETRRVLIRANDFLIALVWHDLPLLLFCQDRCRTWYDFYQFSVTQQSCTGCNDLSADRWPFFDDDHISERP